MGKFLFFDHASTTPCSEAALKLVEQYAREDYGNPSSAHIFGQRAAQAIRQARVFFSETFRVEPNQIIFTGSGSEADNFAIYGTALEALTKKNGKPQVLASATDHPAVRKTALSLAALGVKTDLIPVDSQGQILRDEMEALLTPETALVSIQQVNNITGVIHPVEELAKIVKRKCPSSLFHTDSVQAFTKIPHPTAPSAVDMVSISAHKIYGPKGVGALILLNKDLLKSRLRPLIWGGDQENGFRSGTQNAGLIAAFHVAAREAFSKAEENRARFREMKSLLQSELEKSPLIWNSPEDSVPNIVNLSLPGYPSGAFAKLLEERGCLVSTGSACSSLKMEPDAVLSAMGIPPARCASAIRISFGQGNQLEDVRTLAHALDESISLMKKLLGGGSR